MFVAEIIEGVCDVLNINKYCGDHGTCVKDTAGLSLLGVVCR